MKLSITNDDGVIYKVWNIEEDFGNIEMPGARRAMQAEITEEIRKHLFIERQAEAHAKVDMKRFEK